MRVHRQAVINTVLIVVIVLALAGGALFLFHPFRASTASATGTLLTTTVKQGTVSSTISATGSVEPVQTVDADFATSGTVATVNVAVGQTVTAGQTLGTLSTTDLQTALNNAETSYTYALQDLTAAETPSSPGQTVSTSQVNSAKQSVATALTAVTTAKENLADATLTAPIAGLVIAVNGQVGATSGSSNSSSSSGSTSGSTAGGATTGATTSTTTSSSSSSAFVEIADTSSYTVTANIAEADIADVTVGQAATITYPALASTVTSTAKVSAIAPTATSSNSVVTYATTITLTSVPTGLRLGQTADVTITTKTSGADALYVPAAAITTANGTSTVKIENTATGKETTKTVKLGIVGDVGTEITSGLTAGETVVLGTASASTTTTTGTTGTGTGTGGFGTGTGGFGGGGFGGRNGGTGGTGGTGAGAGTGGGNG